MPRASSGVEEVQEARSIAAAHGTRAAPDIIAVAVGGRIARGVDCDTA